MKHVLLGLIRLYQVTLSRLLPPTCRFAPSCSQYSYEAIARYGAWRGGWLAVKRICRCHPFNPGGYDPVPNLEEESLNRSRSRHWPITLLILAVLLLGLSGCTGARAQSWLGLTLVEDTLYAADLQQARAMDAKSGETLWAFPDDPKDDNRGVFYATPVVSDGRVIVSSQTSAAGFLSQEKNIVWAVDAETGNELWRFDEAGGRYVEGGAVSDDTLVIGNGDGNVYALDAESGTLKWTFETDHHVWAMPLIVSDTVYIGSLDRHLYALRLSDGEKVWDFHTNGAFAGKPALEDGTLYIGAFDDNFYAIDAETGTERWHFEGEDWFWGSPEVRDGAVYATDVGGDVYALKADSGEVIWHQEFESPIRAGPALSEDGDLLFVGSRDGILHALEISDGFELWSDEGEGRALSKPVVRGEVVYEALIYGPHRIKALQVDDGREVWVHPEVEEE